MSKCDRWWCPRRASQGTRDIRQIEPVEEDIVYFGKPGKRIKTQAPASDWRLGCSWHPPVPSKFIKLPEEEK